MNVYLVRTVTAAVVVAGGVVLTPGAALASTATITVDSAWAAGYVARLTIHNTETTPLTDWKVEFDLAPDANVQSAWNVTFTHVGGHWTAKPAGYSAAVPAGGSFTAGFVASGTSRPTGCLLNGAPCDGVATTPDVTPPSTPGKLSPLPTAAGRIGYGWAPSTDDHGVVRYEVFVDNQKVTETTYTNFIEPTPTNPRWVIGVRAVDAAGNASPFSTQVSGWPVDTVPPSAPTDLRIAGAAGVPGYLAASWTASTDTVTVAGYEVTVNGRTTLTSNTRLLFPVHVPQVYTVRVRAYDAAGNFSPATTLTLAEPPA